MNSFFIIYFSLGIACGFSTSLFGFGGGFLIVPSLYWILNITTNIASGEIIKISITTSLFVMLLSTLTSIIKYNKTQIVNWDLAKCYLFPISMGSLFTIFTATKLDGDYIRFIFIFYMLSTIVLSLRKSFFQKISASRNYKPSILSAWLFGIPVGFSASTIGVGGSVFTMPHFRKKGIKMNDAIPIANTLTLPIAVIGFLSYFLSGIFSNFQTHEITYIYSYVHFSAALLIFAGSIGGVSLGVKISQLLPDGLYAKGYFILLILTTAAISVKI